MVIFKSMVQSHTIFQLRDLAKHRLVFIARPCVRRRRIPFEVELAYANKIKNHALRELWKGLP
jgi:hypothetical protein